MSALRFVSRLVSAAAASTLIAAAPNLAAAGNSVAAVWVPKHVQFVYQAFTAYYSCDGLRGKITDMLEKMGARDLKVRQFGCVRVSGPSPFPGVRVNMLVLVPTSSADAAKEKHAGTAVQAHWKKVVLMPENPGLSELGNCELIEQFKETFLPLFATRNVEYQATCVPHQINLGTYLSAEVLTAAPKAARGSSS